MGVSVAKVGEFEPLGSFLRSLDMLPLIANFPIRCLGRKLIVTKAQESVCCNGMNQVFALPLWPCKSAAQACATLDACDSRMLLIARRLLYFVNHRMTGAISTGRASLPGIQSHHPPSPALRAAKALWSASISLLTFHQIEAQIMLQQARPDVQRKHRSKSCRYLQTQATLSRHEHAEIVSQLWMRLLWWNSSNARSVHMPADDAARAHAEATGCWGPWRE
eukprot:12920-Pleurochrysis_carterae.AAC.1